MVNAATTEKMGRGGHPGGRRFARFEEDVKEKPLDYWKIARKTVPLLVSAQHTPDHIIGEGSTC